MKPKNTTLIHPAGAMVCFYADLSSLLSLLKENLKCTPHQYLLIHTYNQYPFPIIVFHFNNHTPTSNL